MQPKMSTQQQHTANRVQLSDKDLANFVLSELKRVAREYTTAALEASDPQIRQLFERALQQTLQDQEKLFKVMGSLNMSGQPMMATRQDLQSELQSNAQTSQKLRSWTEQSLQSASASLTHSTMGTQAQGSSSFAPSYQPPSYQGRAQGQMTGQSGMTPTGFTQQTPSYYQNTGYTPASYNQGLNQRRGASYGQTGPTGYGSMNTQQQGYGQMNYSNQGGGAMGVNPVYRQEQHGQSYAMQEQRVQTAKGTAAQPYNTIQHNPNHPQNKSSFVYGVGGDMSPSGYGTSNSTEPRIQMDEEGVLEEQPFHSEPSSRGKASSSRKKSTTSQDISPSAAMYQTASQSDTEYNTSGTSQTKRHVTGNGESESQTN